MIASFADQGTGDIFNDVNSKKARSALPRPLWPAAQELLDLLNAAVHYSELAIPTSNGLHPLGSDRQGQMAVKINRQYRICFRFEKGEFHDVEILDYH